MLLLCTQGKFLVGRCCPGAWLLLAALLLPAPRCSGEGWSLCSFQTKHSSARSSLLQFSIPQMLCKSRQPLIYSSRA